MGLLREEQRRAKRGELPSDFLFQLEGKRGARRFSAAQAAPCRAARPDETLQILDTLGKKKKVFGHLMHFIPAVSEVIVSHVAALPE